ncbi:hypothetical protein F5Y15DRAFT_403159 [Xylariaceae sp. FL0016]|nr:hypothetical protein F5Y15DRAFT_403159 [Xylariaceae sp. FL0016]
MTQDSNHGRGHLTAVLPDPALPPQAYYRCNRCGKAGHWIRYCPTNLDPRYDVAPTEDYKCRHCGIFGDHFSTLCPRNTYEGSLTQQRETLAIQSSSPYRREYHSSRDSRSPIQDYRTRSRSPIGQRRKRSRFSYQMVPSYHKGSVLSQPYSSSRGRGESTCRKRRRTPDSREVSPYSTRGYLTHRQDREPRGSSSYVDSQTKGRCRSYSPKRRAEDSPRRRGRTRSRPKEDEGRLAYDDEPTVCIELDQRVQLPTGEHAREPLTTLNAMKHATRGVSFVTGDTLEGIRRAKFEAENFLRRAETLLERPPATSTSNIVNRESVLQSSLISDSRSEPCDVTNPTDHMDIDRNLRNDKSESGTTIHDSSIVQKHDGTLIRLVHEPQFRSEVVALFKHRENPIVHHQSRRKTAVHMFKEAYLR